MRGGVLFGSDEDTMMKMMKMLLLHQCLFLTIFFEISPDFKPFLHCEHAVIPAPISCVRDLCSGFRVIEDLTWFAATVELTWLVQLTEMSGTSNSGYFVCLLWKGCLNGSLVTNSTWRLTSIYPHFLSRLLHSCFPPVFVSTVCVSLSHGPCRIF